MKTIFSFPWKPTHLGTRMYVVFLSLFILISFGIGCNKNMPMSSLGVDSNITNDAILKKLNQPSMSETLQKDTLIVSGTANIFGAGHATAPDPGGGGGGVLPPKVSFSVDAGKILIFPSVTGIVDCCSGTQPNGPDGNTRSGTNINSFDGISGIINNDKRMFLVGVFLDDSEPLDPAPNRLNFTGADDFTELSPLLNQVFFIGDGLTGTGVGNVQRFIVPAGATRLYLGFEDADNFQGNPGWYNDNTGELAVTLGFKAL